MLKTEGNLNNLIGVPLTLFRLNETQQAAVVEMGMNHPGEIDRLAAITAPDIGVITNVARAHLEGLGTLARVAQAKGELLNRLSKTGLAVLNADESSFPALKKRARSRVTTFGKTQKASVRLLNLTKSGLNGIAFRARLGGHEQRLKLSVPGRHNALNALAAAAVGLELHISPAQIAKGLKAYRSVSQRMEILPGAKKTLIINDCYNSNPDSASAALQFLKEADSPKARRVAILGEMLELGKDSARLHRELGRVAAGSGVELLCAIGPHAAEVVSGFRGLRKTKKVLLAFSNAEEALPVLLRHIYPRDLVLIKGSRGMKLERVTEALQKGKN